MTFSRPAGEKSHLVEGDTLGYGMEPNILIRDETLQQSAFDAARQATNSRLRLSGDQLIPGKLPRRLSLRDWDHVLWESFHRTARVLFHPHDPHPGFAPLADGVRFGIAQVLRDSGMHELTQLEIATKVLDDFAWAPSSMPIGGPGRPFCDDLALMFIGLAAAQPVFVPDDVLNRAVEDTITNPGLTNRMSPETELRRIEANFDDYYIEAKRRWNGKLIRRT